MPLAALSTLSPLPLCPDDLSPSASPTPDPTYIASLLEPRPPTTLSAGPQEVLAACGISWDASDIARFLSYCQPDQFTNCLIWAGGKSRGRGKTAWYGSFRTKGKTVRAHKFYGVAVLGYRPQTGVHQLDHTCVNSLCVCHIACVPSYINRALQWIRVQVGLEDPPDYHAAVILRLSQWIAANPRPEHPEWQFIPDPYDPRYWTD